MFSEPVRMHMLLPMATPLPINTVIVLLIKKNDVDNEMPSMPDANYILF